MRGSRTLIRLKAGEQVYNPASHHVAMALLKSELGDPRPAGLLPSGRPVYTLSLVRVDSPSCYDGRDGRRLSTDPSDYAWETYSENFMRKPAEVRRSGGVAAAAWWRSSASQAARDKIGQSKAAWWQTPAGREAAVRLRARNAGA